MARYIKLRLPGGWRKVVLAPDPKKPTRRAGPAPVGTEYEMFRGTLYSRPLSDSRTNRKTNDHFTNT